MAVTCTITGGGPVSRTNFITNPRAVGAVAGWSFNAAGGTYSLNYPATGGPTGIPTYTQMTWTSSATGPGGGIKTPLATLPTGEYYATMWVRTNVSAPSTTIGLRIGGGTATTSELGGLTTTGVSGAWVLISRHITVTSPGTVQLYATHLAGTTWPNGGRLEATGAFITEKPYLYPYFDGSSTDAEWAGVTNDSISFLYPHAAIEYEMESYSEREDSSPTLVLDSSGAVGTFSGSITIPENPANPVNMYGTGWLLDKRIEIHDTRFGTVAGTIDTVGRKAATVPISGTTTLGALNIYNIQAQPVVGTLQDAFIYYLSLAGITSNYFVDPSIASRPVNYTGWNGELWYHLKMLASAQQCDIVVLEEVITLRPLREREIQVGYTTQVDGSVGGGSTAQKVEVYYYQTRAIVDELVYPAGGWNMEVEILNVNAGEVAEHTIELGASLSSFQEPVMLTDVDSDYDASSVYTIVADDGLPLDPDLWTAFGGKVEFILNPDTTTITVRMVGAIDVPTVTEGFSKSFSLALAADYTGNRYSTLRIVGTGVSFVTEKLDFPTGLTPQQTGTEVGITIDNPFLNDMDTVTNAGLQAAKGFTGIVPSLSATVVRVNRPESSDPTFGNIAGARFWDEITKRWYRVRSASVTPDSIVCESADDDLLWSDMNTLYTGMTYADVQALNQGLTYQEVRLAGART